MSAAHAKTAWEMPRRIRPGLWEIARSDGTASYRTQVDIADEHLLEGVRWRVSFYGYLERDVWDRDAKKTRRLYFARVVLGAPEGMDVDHVNRDRRDNRRANLRIVTRAQNRQNVTSYGKTSRYRGVSRTRGRGRLVWEAGYGSAPRRYRERFATEDEAAIVAWRWRVENIPMCRDEPCPV